MEELKIQYNGQTITAKYNKDSGNYEAEFLAEETGVKRAEIEFTDLLGNKYYGNYDIQVYAKEKVSLQQRKTFIWIFDWRDISVKDIIEIQDYEINIDEETNATTIIKVLKDLNASSQDYVAVKINNEDMYWGVIESIENENGTIKNSISCKYFTNMFDVPIGLNREDDDLMKAKIISIEEQIARAIKENFTEVENDPLFREIYGHIEVLTQTETFRDIHVSNTESDIYNLHTWMTNCTQNYGITYRVEPYYDVEEEKNKLRFIIANQENEKELIDVKAQSIANYQEVFDTNVLAKVIVLTEQGKYQLFMRNDRTTTEDPNDPDRAKGKIRTIAGTTMADARQTAIEQMRGNTYNHNISFSLNNKLFKIGTMIAIKTKKSIIYDTYISAIKITPKSYIDYQCGNIRINFIEKLLKERRN